MASNALSQMTDRLPRWRRAHGLVRSAWGWGIGALGLVATLEVLGQFGGDCVQPAGPCGFKPPADTAYDRVRGGSPAGGLQKLAVKIVPEGIKL